MPILITCKTSPAGVRFSMNSNNNEVNEKDTRNFSILP